MEGVFNLGDWLPEKKEASHIDPSARTNRETPSLEADVERIVSDIEASQRDLTGSYQEWLQMGFAFANEFGEMGRSYFHRVSQFNTGYTVAECDKKFDSCLKSSGTGTTIKTFFYLAKQAGFELASSSLPSGSLPSPASVPPACPDSSVACPDSSGSPSSVPPACPDSSVACPDSSVACPDPSVAPSPEPKASALPDDLLAESQEFNTPTLPEQIYVDLPRLLIETSRLFNPGNERDIFLLSALTVLSSLLPNIEGFYFNWPLSPHIYLFITGPSASGKGTMVWARSLAQCIQDELKRETAQAQEEYQQQLELYESLPKKGEATRPQEPAKKTLFIPANSSTSSLIQTLVENNFKALIFETEADSMTNAAKQDWGDSSDIFRKAFHHENTSMSRRKDKEFIEITNPHLAICLSGTPHQVHRLMPEIENGLFSRFMYYAFNDNRGFLNPFVSLQPIHYNYFFRQKSYEVFHLYERLGKLTQPIEFQLTVEQGIQFTQFFGQMLAKNKMLLSRDLDANTKRLGVITFRIAMILTALRLMEQEPGEQMADPLICSDQDFKTALSIATTLESHAVAVYQKMPKVNLKGARLIFYERLPDQFNRNKYLEVAKELGITAATADKYIYLFNNHLLDHQYNEYTKRK